MKTLSKGSKIIGLILLVLVELGLTLYLAQWREVFWGAVESKDYTTFVWYLGYFAIVAMTLCFTVSYQQYLTTVLGLCYRTDLTKKALKSTVHHDTMRQIKQEDCFSYPQLALGLAVGLIRNICLVGIYVWIVAKVGVLYLTLPVLYSILATVVCYKLAYPLIDLNYFNQSTEAKFRELLSKVSYSKALRNNFELAKATKKLGYFQVGFGQIGVVLPYIFLSGLYFGSTITFGALMMTASSMNSLIDSLSFFTSSFNDINKLAASRRRLKMIGVL